MRTFTMILSSYYKLSPNRKIYIATVLGLFFGIFSVQKCEVLDKDISDYNYPLQVDYSG